MRVLSICCEYLFFFFRTDSIEIVPSSESDTTKSTEFASPAEATKMVVNQQHLKQAWDVSRLHTQEAWDEWGQRISVEFMKQSPSHALRACLSLVEARTPMAKEVFNAAFLSCWGELYDQYQVSPASSLYVGRFADIYT